MVSDKSVDILVAEDRNFERTSIVAALEAAVPDVNIVSIGDGSEVMDFLFGQGIWAQRDTSNVPKLVILDLGLPGVDGLAILHKIRSLDPSEPLVTTPVVIFSDSKDSQKISECYLQGANSYIVKPVLIAEFSEIIVKIGIYWIRYNRLP